LTIIESGFETLSLRRKSLNPGRLTAPVVAFGDPSKNAFRRGNTLPDDQLDLLRSVLARAYEKRQRLPLGLLQALKDYIGLHTRRKPIIESLNIIERKTDAA
jgi:hypothetical protein